MNVEDMLVGKMEGRKKGRKEGRNQNLTHFDANDLFLTYSNMCEINKKTNLENTWRNPCSVKVFEVDIYQLFVQMRQVKHRQIFRFYSHIWDLQITIDRDK